LFFWRKETGRRFPVQRAAVAAGFYGLRTTVFHLKDRSDDLPAIKAADRTARWLSSLPPTFWHAINSAHLLSAIQAGEWAQHPDPDRRNHNGTGAEDLRQWSGGAVSGCQGL